MLTPARFGPLAAFAGACADEVPFELRQAAEHGQHEPPMGRRRVSQSLTVPARGWRILHRANRRLISLSPPIAVSNSPRFDLPLALLWGVPT